MPPPGEKPQRKWPGLLLSIFIPGFGLIRAGKILCGLAWFFGLYFAGVPCTYLLVSDDLPLGFGLAALLAFLLLWLTMLWESFRPGRMSLNLWIVFALLLVFVWVCPSSPEFIGRAFQVPTASMEPALLGSSKDRIADHVFVNRLSYLAAKPKRGDIIVFRAAEIRGIPSSHTLDPQDYFFAMRIVGLPGERIEIKDGAVWANGAKLGPADGIPPIDYTLPPGAKLAEGEAILIEPDRYFVLGDNSPHSFDSRFWGTVPASAIFGKVTKIYYPLDRAGLVK